jgi:membrane protein
MGFIRQAWNVISDAACGWIHDEAMSMAASIAFYTAFSLAPIVILVTTVAGLVFGQEAAQGALVDQLAGLFGPDVAQTVENLTTSASDRKAGLWASLLGVATLIVGATTVFTELQTALNRVWKAEPPPEAPLTWLVKVRLKGLALIGAIGFLLIVSLTVSTALAALSTWARHIFPGLTVLLWIVNILVSWTVFTTLFALVYHVLPDIRTPWKEIWMGAAITALLFLVGKLLIGLYLGTVGVASAYGAARSFVLILLWVYYSAAIFLFGAEITRAYSKQLGSRARREQRPDASALRATAGLA